MNRRDFLRLSALFGGALATGQVGCSRDDAKPKVESPVELESRLLNEFLIPKEAHLVDRGYIESNLYYISEKDGDEIKGVNLDSRIGQAVHIGDNYFLTAYHVIEGGRNLQLKPQNIGSISFSRPQNFQVLYHDESSDLALLRCVANQRSGIPKMHLGPVPSVGDEVSTFETLSMYLLKLLGHNTRKTFELEYDGVNFYDEKKTAAKLGRMVLPPNSDLLEKKGRVMNYEDEKLWSMQGSHKEHSANVSLTSVLAYGGDSGSPMFFRVGPDKYLLAGILTASLITRHMLKTPNHPIYRRGMQQTGAVFIHRMAVERFIRDYLNAPML